MWIGIRAGGAPPAPLKGQRAGRTSRHLVKCGAVLLTLALGLFALSGTAQALSLAEALLKVEPEALLTGADRFGPLQGTPPIAPILRGNEPLGVAFLNADFADATGYSGKPINILLSLDQAGVIRAAKLIEHHEPIVLVGIPEAKIADYLAGFVGQTAANLGRETGETTQSVEVVSGATVTIMVIQDSVRRAARLLTRRLGIANGAGADASSTTGDTAIIDLHQETIADWASLLAEGAIHRRLLRVGAVSADFQAAGKADAAARPESRQPDDTLIDLYTALVSVPAIGRSLLGGAEYAALTKALPPGQQAILVAADGLYSFKGSGYVRGGIFDRIQLIQGDQAVRFRDRDHKHLGAIEAAGAPRFREIALFTIPAGVTFDPTAPWRLDLLVQRAVGPLKKEFLSYGLGYSLPERFILRQKAAPQANNVITAAIGAATAAPTLGTEEAPSEPLWRKVWRARALDIEILSAALLLLTGLFFFQNWFVRRPKLLTTIRVGFLIFVVGWLGGYAHAQLSVVNILAFANTLITGFKWDYFLIDPLIFLLWISVVVSLLFWGRGAFCGWLCPFGAAQELVNRLAKLARVPQMAVPWWLHERLWPLKYVIFLGLFGYALYSLSDAETYAEVEPFKTAVILRFSREWWFVLYAGGLLGIGLFVERFFCRYLCPLGGALAIPGRLRTFDWLRRYKECGSPCQRCAHECMVQAIHEDGRINPNECLYCLHCQTLYYDDQRCPHMVQQRLRRDRLDAMSGGRVPAGRAATVETRDPTKPPPIPRGPGSDRPQ